MYVCMYALWPPVIEAYPWPQNGKWYGDVAFDVVDSCDYVELGLRPLRTGRNSCVSMYIWMVRSFMHSCKIFCTVVARE
jgi:hypothetical protein